MAAPPDPPPPALPTAAQRALLRAVFVGFVAAWAVVGVRGLVADDSRWAWGMFPYVLAVKVEEVRFVDADGRTRPWRHTGKTRIPRAVRPGAKNETYGYGKGGYDDLIARLLDVAAKDAAARDVAVEAVVVTTRSERPAQREVVRREVAR